MIFLKQNFSSEMIDKMYEEVLKNERVIFQRTVTSESLNHLQLCTHDLIIKALMLNENESIIDSGNSVSRL